MLERLSILTNLCQFCESMMTVIFCESPITKVMFLRAMRRRTTRRSRGMIALEMRRKKRRKDTMAALRSSGRPRLATWAR
jgi:hypothetical protein